MDDISTDEMVLPISQAVKVRLETDGAFANGSQDASVDPYVALEQIATIQDQWGIDGSERFSPLRDCLAELMGRNRDEITINQGLDFESFIVAACKRLDDERKKKRDSIVCSPQSTPESRTTFLNGQSVSEQPGSQTQDTSSPTKSE